LLAIALEEGKLHESQFFYQLIASTLHNITHYNNPQSFHHDNAAIIEWCLLLRYIGGACVLEVIRGVLPQRVITEHKADGTTCTVLDYLNIPIPSLATLKRWLPKLNLGSWIERHDLKELARAMHDEGCSMKICLAYDEIEICWTLRPQD
jgi:hypothetical protein